MQTLLTNHSNRSIQEIETRDLRQVPGRETGPGFCLNRLGERPIEGVRRDAGKRASTSGRRCAITGHCSGIDPHCYLRFVGGLRR
jgi:hypothetical protein